MPSIATLKALGLNTSPNSIEIPEGSLLQAKNIIIRRDNVIESRRGLKLFGNSFGNPSDRAKQLLTYKKRILRHYNDVLQYQSGETFASFPQSLTEAETKLRIKSLEMNGNLYLTSSDGIKKISVKNASDLPSAQITNAGGIKALDTQAKLNVSLGDTTGFLTQDSAVSYRAVWGIKDSNNNLILGTPSPLIEVYNYLSNLLLRDYNNLLNALDTISTSMINDANYVSTYKLDYNATPSQISNKLVDLANKIDTDILYADDNTTPANAPLTLSTNPTISSGVCTITFTASPNATDYFVAGSKIKLSGFIISDKSFTFNSTADVNTTTDRITISAHGLADGNQISFTGVIPSGISPSTPYYIINATTNDFQIASSPSGSQIDITATAVGTGTMTVVSSGDINTEQTITTVSNTDITFNTSAKGSVTMSNPKIISYEYTYIIKNPSTEDLTTYVIDTPTPNSELSVLQGKLDKIFARLQSEPNAVIPVEIRSAYIDTLLTTQAASVDLYVTIPDDITVNHFLQIYRSALVTANGAVALEDLSPGDELRQVYEAFPTQNELNSRLMVINDVVPESFRLSGANLYTNSATGDGPLQANDIPPYAKDIELFKGYVFYANAKTRHRKSLSLLGVSALIDSYNAGNEPKITIADGISTNTYSFVTGQKETTEFDFVGLTGSTINGKSLTIYSANDEHKYKVFYNTGISTISTGATVTITTNDNHNLTTGDEVVIAASDSTPSIDGKYTITVTGLTTFDIAPAQPVTIAGTSGNWYKNYSGYTVLPINLDSLDADTDIAIKTRDRLSVYSWDFTASSSTTKATITNFEYGYCTNATASSGIVTTITQDGRGDKVTQEKVTLDFTSLTGASFTSSGSSDYLVLNNVYGRNSYYIWFKRGTSTDPAIANKTGIMVTLTGSETNIQLAQKVELALSSYDTIFSTSLNSSILTVTNVYYGPVIDASSPQMPVGFILTKLEDGALEVLISESTSPAQAVNETSQSLVRIINRNTTEIVNAFYLSSSAQIPGSLNIEARTLNDVEFYILANSASVGATFNPDLSPSITGISNTAANPTVITATNHGLSDGSQVLISGSNSTPSIDGLYTISNSSTNSFTIPINVLVAGNKGSIKDASLSEVSSNDEDPHRIYYSKYQQPEAVPILNYIEVGAKDKSIVRIFALRDSLFVFKEDGLYRISSESPPWTVSLFDSSCILVAPDSLDVSNNQVFGWTTQGISTVSEGGVQIISRPIDVDIIPRSSSNYANFKTATWGVGYESDNSYIVFTVNTTEDETATIAYRYSNLTNSWTLWDKSATCGIVNPTDDKLYIGAGDTNYIEQERKSFTRFDYADRELSSTLSINNYLSSGLQIKLASVSGLSIGDVVYQSQTLSPYTFNMLLQKLDNDPSVPSVNYYSSLKAVGGDNMRSKIVSLATKLDSDLSPSPTYSSIIQALSLVSITSNSDDSPSIVTSPSHGLITGRKVSITGVTGSSPTINGTQTVTVVNANTFSVPVEVLTAGTGGSFTTINEDFDDIKICYNAIIAKLNLDPNVSFNNYNSISSNTEIEAVITDINVFAKTITLNIGLEFVQGPLTIFKAIDTEVLYAPVTMGDPVNLKHIRDATIMFANRAFTRGTLSFSTDLAPAFTDIVFSVDGNGIFGHSVFGSGYFGGGSNAAPLRTYIPREHQRCRYMNVKFNHRVARELYAIYGITLTGEVGQSSRAYR